jgi:hypothetical protein
MDPEPESFLPEAIQQDLCSWQPLAFAGDQCLPQVEKDNCNSHGNWSRSISTRAVNARQLIPTAVKPSSMAEIFSAKAPGARFRNKVLALSRTAVRLSVNCEVRDNRCVTAR